MPLECCLSRRRGSPTPLGLAQVENLRYAGSGEGHFGNTDRGRDAPPTGFATVSKYAFGRDRPARLGICPPDQGKLLFRSGSGARIEAGLPPPPDRYQSQ